MHDPATASGIRLFSFASLLLLVSCQALPPEDRYLPGAFPAYHHSTPGEIIIPEASPSFKGSLTETGLSPGAFPAYHHSTPGKIIIPEASLYFEGLLTETGTSGVDSPFAGSEVPDSGLLTGPPRENFRLIFYNVENLFDTADEPGKNDDAFTPEGDRRWTEYRLRHKINNIYKALVAAAGFEIPAIIGLCEVENRYVLERLTGETGLKNFGYGIIHRNSADTRGIDVAMLYRPDSFVVLDTLFRSIRFPFDTLAATRDILYVKGLAAGADTLHIFVNHWVSRWGGQAATEPYRNYTATILKSLTDSIFGICRRSNIVIMGDFNDEPEESSLKKYLGAVTEPSDPFPGKLYNLSQGDTRIPGTLKFQGEWFLFDQFIVSGSMLDGRGSLHTNPGSFRIFSAGFLLVPDERWFGYKPFRSYEGFRYTGGYSDHLPVVLDIWW